MRPSQLSLPLLLLVASLGGCGGRRCDKESDVDKRDWCFYDAATGLHGGQQIDGITGAIGNIQSPMVRSLAVQKILASSPDQFTQQQAETLCGTLSDRQSSLCLRNWSRPHLWTKN